MNSGHARQLKSARTACDDGSVPPAVDAGARARLNGHQACVVWLTGLSAAGKTSIARALEFCLHDLGRRTYVLDGDDLRHHLNGDLGFSAADRAENVRRVAEVARLMSDAGLIVIVSCISPFRADRARARALTRATFFEVFVDAPLELVERRDPKGLYRRARAGLLKDFTGIDSPYEPPLDPEVHVDTARVGLEQAVRSIFDALSSAGIVPGTTLG